MSEWAGDGAGADGQPADEATRLAWALELLQRHAARLGDDVVDRAGRPLRERLRALAAPSSPSAPPLAPRLRQVSVLFVDIVGSTRLLQTLDAEDSHAVLDGALRRFAEVVHRHGGRVLRFMGDGLKAAFGLPEPADDDAVRAVRAARELLAEARAHAEAMRTRLGDLPFEVRAGLHTGPVALGAGAEEAQTLVGATVHLAARLEQHAPPGALLVSQVSWRLTRGVFDFQVQAPLQVKGVPDPVQTYRLLGERPPGQRRSAHGIDGLDVGLIGRDRPLGVLIEAVQALSPGRPGTLVTVTGEPGVGKSRLRQALLEQLTDAAAAGLARAPVQVLVAQAWPETAQAPWGLLRELLLRHAGLTGDEAAPQAALQLREALMGTTPASDADGPDGALTPAQALALAYAVGVVDAGQVRSAGLTTNPGALRAVVQQACLAWWRAQLRRGPVLLLIDDLHWADDGSLDLVRQWQRELADQPLSMVVLARPALMERRPDWPLAGDKVRHIELTALDVDATHSLVDALLARLRPVPAPLRMALLQRSGGNPYFIEEMVGALIDSGDLDTSGEEWRLRSGADSLLGLPATLAGTLQARVARLRDADRLALQQAAVVGPLVPGHALAAIDPAALQAMPSLVQLGLLVPVPGEAWRFHHQLLQQAAYDTVLRRDREPWHARVAAHLAARPDSPAFWVARHFEQAGDHAAAVLHYREAALGPSGRLSRPEQRLAAQRALALSPQADARWRWPLLSTITNASLLMRDLDTARSQLPQLSELAESLDDDGLRVEVERARVMADGQENSPDRMAVVIQLAEQAHRRQPGERLPRLLGLYGWALLNSGRPAEARQVAERGIGLSAEAGLPPARECLESAGIAAWKLGDLSAGLARLQMVQRQSQAISDVSGEIASLGNLSNMARTLGDYDTWKAALHQAIALADSSGQTFGMPLFRAQRARWLLHDGQCEAALAEVRRALALLPPDDRWFRITALLSMGHVHLGRARAVANGAGSPGANGAHAAACCAEARAAFEAALAGSVDAGMRSEAQHGLVLTALAEGRPERAAAHADALQIEMSDPQPGDATERPAQWLAVADARRAAGDRAAAERALRAARDDLLDQAARISDEAARARFLSAVPHNRRILEQAA